MDALSLLGPGLNLFCRRPKGLFHPLCGNLGELAVTTEDLVPRLAACGRLHLEHCSAALRLFPPSVYLRPVNVGILPGDLLLGRSDDVRVSACKSFYKRRLRHPLCAEGCLSIIGPQSSIPSIGNSSPPWSGGGEHRPFLVIVIVIVDWVVTWRFVTRVVEVSGIHIVGVLLRIRHVSK